jgi:hypothetical protein
MKRKPVESSMIRSVGYDPLMSILEIEFTSSHVYQYGEISEETYRELLAADSKGQYFHAYILDQYPHVRVK